MVTAGKRAAETGAGLAAAVVEHDVDRLYERTGPFFCGRALSAHRVDQHSHLKTDGVRGHDSHVHLARAKSLRRTEHDHVHVAQHGLARSAPRRILRLVPSANGTYGPTVDSSVAQGTRTPLGDVLVADDNPCCGTRSRETLRLSRDARVTWEGP